MLTIVPRCIIFLVVYKVYTQIPTDISKLFLILIYIYNNSYFRIKLNAIFLYFYHITSREINIECTLFKFFTSDALLKYITNITFNQYYRIAQQVVYLFYTHAHVMVKVHHRHLKVNSMVHKIAIINATLVNTCFDISLFTNKFPAHIRYSHIYCLQVVSYIRQLYTLISDIAILVYYRCFSLNPHIEIVYSYFAASVYSWYVFYSDKHLESTLCFNNFAFKKRFTYRMITL